MGGSDPLQPAAAAGGASRRAAVSAVHDEEPTMIQIDEKIPQARAAAQENPNA